MTLYLKYRPQNLDDIDSVEVRESLKKIVSKKSLPHAFLFSGPKGIGKTSTARILAKIVNCEGKNPPCNKCEECTTITKGTNIDVIEIDGASHRGIDDIRSLRDAVKLSPASAKKKVYIIDEAHMLTTEASNALLKTLEEPPSHVMFILATTNPEKLIETIRSRAVLIQFKKAKDSEIVTALKKVVKGEKVKVDESDLNIIAKSADGSFRDAVKILEQVITEGKSVLLKSSFNTDEFIEFLVKKDTAMLIKMISTVTESGGSVENFISAILLRLRSALLYKVNVGGEDITGFSKNELISLIELLGDAYKDISYYPSEEIPLEIAVIKWCGEQVSNNIENGSGEDVGREEVKKIDVPAQDNHEKKMEPIKIGTMVKEISDDVWRSVLTTIRPLNASIEALLRAAKPVEYDGKTLTLGVFYKFHKERLEEGQNRRLLEDVVANILGSPVRVSCTLSTPPVKAPLTESTDNDIIKIAEEIFSN